MFYIIICIASILIRQFVLPNPFEPIGDLAALVNLLVGLGLSPITYAMVGCIYDSGSAPAVGALLYLAFYAFNTGVIYLICLLCPTMWPKLVIAVVYFVAAFFGLSKVGECLR